jgi:hypothetical protein
VREPNAWIDVFNATTWRQFLDAGAQVSGSPSADRNTMQLERGDSLAPMGSAVRPTDSFGGICAQRGWLLYAPLARRSYWRVSYLPSSTCSATALAAPLRVALRSTR